MLECEDTADFRTRKEVLSVDELGVEGANECCVGTQYLQRRRESILLRKAEIAIGGILGDVGVETNCLMSWASECMKKRQVDTLSLLIH